MSGQSTTTDLVELVRGMFEASRGDLDAGVNFLAPDAVWEVAGLAASFEGVAAIRGVLEEWLGAYQEFEMEPVEVSYLGDGVVSAIARQNARLVGSTGSASLREVFLYVFVWVDGMVVRVTTYPDIDEARAAAERLAEEQG